MRKRHHRYKTTDESVRPASEPQSSSSKAPSGNSTASKVNWGVLCAALLSLLIWSYWPTFTELIERWYHVPDYSHGFLIIPGAAMFLWIRRHTRPSFSRDGQWLGAITVVAAIIFRYFGARAYLPAFDAWSIMIWVSGVCLWLGGKRFFIWCSPAIMFLFFMVPLPYRAEHMLNVPLRSVAASSSCFLLQCLGQPAGQEGTLIVLNDEEFEVARECSGLRMLMGVCALSFAYVVISQGPFWQKALILVSALPVAVLANVLRVTITALLVHFTDNPSVRSFVHDAAGWVTFAIAAGLFSVVLWCLGRMFVEVEIEEGAHVFRTEFTH